MTGGRLKRVMPYLEDDEDFCFTYGDGVADIDITALVAYHRDQGVQATLTAVQPAGRFGALALDEDDRVRSFEEKPRGDGAWTNGGFFVLSPSVAEYLGGDDTIWEQEPVRRLAARGQLASYKHTGYWQAMDTIRERAVLEELWESGRAPWCVW
jgi:glucose-1-phosphate cytidylyltransferase